MKRKVAILLPMLALACCGGCGQAPAKTVPDLIAMAQDRDPAKQTEALTTLGAMGPQAKAAIPVMIQALKSPQVGVRFAAANAIGEMGSEAREAVPALAAALDAQGMTVLPPPPDVREDPDFDYQAYQNSQILPVQRAAAIALGKIGPEARSALPALKKFAQETGESCGSVSAAITKISQ